jgi:Family of unknown function (DUF5723)
VAFIPKTQAQHELSLHFMDSLWQSNYTNPAFQFGEGKTTASLPSFYGNFMSPYSASQLTVDVEGKKTLNFKSAFNGLNQSSSRFNMNTEVQTAGLALGFKRLNVSLYHKFKAESHIDIAKDLIGGFAYGNQAYLGKTMDLGSGVDGQIYSEAGLGLSYKISEKITIGARVKRLAGFAAVTTVKKKLTLLTDSSDYKLTFNSDFDVRTYDVKRIDEISQGTFSFTDLLRSDNNGFSFDLGATYNLGKLKINASVIDLAGAINWKYGAKTYTSNGTYTYSGFQSSKFLSFDAVSGTDMQDTIKKALNVQEGTSGETKMKLPTKMYLSGTYEVSPKVKLGALIYRESWGDISTMDFMLSSSFHLAKAVTLGATYAVRNSTYNNIGVNCLFTLSALQLYALTDNILAVANSATAKSANVRIGMNLTFK